MKLSQAQLRSIALNTNFMSPNEIALHAMNHVLKDAGALGLRTAKSSVKLVVVLNATKAGASDLNRENVVTFFVLPDVLAPNNPIVW